MKRHAAAMNVRSMFINHAPLDATSSAPCAMAHFRADPSERPAHALATANPTAALLIRAAAGRRGDRELARDGGPRRALPHVARPSVGTAPAATARSMAARATPNGVLCLALTRGSRQDGIAGSVERSVAWASLRLACGSACAVARLDSVDANARHGVQHDSKRLERAVTYWFDRAGAGRHSPPHALDHCFAARRVMRCRCLTLYPQSRHARAHTWP